MTLFCSISYTHGVQWIYLSEHFDSRKYCTKLLEAFFKMSTDNMYIWKQLRIYITKNTKFLKLVNIKQKPLKRNKKIKMRGGRSVKERDIRWCINWFCSPYFMLSLFKTHWPVISNEVLNMILGVNFLLMHIVRYFRLETKLPK